MPITVTTTAGMLDEQAERHIVPRLSQALLARHGFLDNTFMQRVVVGSLITVPRGHLFSSGKADDAIFVELKVPSVTFGTQELRQGFLNDVHAILNDLTRGAYPKDRTFFNIVYTVDGSFGVGDVAYTNAALGEAAAAAPV